MDLSDQRGQDVRRLYDRCDISGVQDAGSNMAGCFAMVGQTMSIVVSKDSRCFKIQGGYIEAFQFLTSVGMIMSKSGVT